MTKQQKYELKAFFEKEEYITELSKRGYSGEKLTDVELDVLRNAKTNIQSLMEIHDLDKETYNKLNNILLNIINTNPIKTEKEERVENITGAENSLSIAIKKELHTSENEKAELIKTGEEKHLNEEYMLSFDESYELAEAKDKILAQTQRLNTLQIYSQFGKLTKTIMTFLSILAVFIVDDVVMGAFGAGTVLHPVTVALTTVVDMVATLLIMIQVIRVAFDTMYLGLPSIREEIAVHSELGNILLHIISPEARLTPIVEKELNSRVDRLEINKALREKYEARLLENKGEFISDIREQFDNPDEDLSIERKIELNSIKSGNPVVDIRNW